MKVYRYRALDVQGRRCDGLALAEDASDLTTQLHERHLELLRARAQRWQLRKPDRRSIGQLFFQLEQLSLAGIPLLDGLRDLRDEAGEPALQALLADLVRRIEGGDQLSAALAAHPRIFPPLLSGLVAAGEHGGRLAEILQAIVRHLREHDELAAQTAKALFYPAIVLTVVGSVAVFLLVSVVPQLQSFIVQSGTSPDAASRLLFGLAALLSEHGVWFAVGVLPMAAGLFGLSRHPTGAAHLQRLLDCLPLLGRIRRDAERSRFAATFGLLYGAGIPVLAALGRTRDILRDQHLQRAVQATAEAIGQGSGIAEACAAHAVLPPLSTRMLRVGEQSGRLEAALAHIAALHRRDAESALARLQTMLEPALTVLLGLLLGWIMLAVLGPIYDIVGRGRP